MSFLPSSQLLTIPFCNDGTEGVDYVLPPIAGNQSSTIQTQQQGIPPVQSEKIGFGGKYVLRDEANGVMRFYTTVLNYINRGGQFTFDAVQSAATGGYDQGAVLFAASNNTFQLSLVDNNTANFIATPTYLNDGINWRQITSSNLNPYPDVVDDISTGNVTIGGRLFNSTNRMFTVDAAGNYASVYTLPDEAGFYKKRALLQVSNAGNTSSGERFTAINFNGMAAIADSVSNGFGASYVSQAVQYGSTNNYQSLTRTNMADGNYGIYECFPSGSGDAILSMGLVNSPSSGGATNTGIYILRNNRPSLINSVAYPPAGENVIVANDLVANGIGVTYVAPNIRRYKDGYTVVEFSSIILDIGANGGFKYNFITLPFNLNNTQAASAKVYASLNNPLGAGIKNITLLSNIYNPSSGIFNSIETICWNNGNSNIGVNFSVMLTYYN